MRAGTMVAVVLAVAVAGCANWTKKLGFTDESDRDWSANNSKPGGLLDPAAPENKRVTVQKFEADFKGVPPKVKVALKNDGEFYDFFSVDVEFGFPAPADSFAEYSPEFVSIDVPEFKKGDVAERVITPPQGVTGVPLFAKLVVTRPEEGVRMTTGRENSAAGVRHGSVLLGGRVEVVEVGGNLSATPPTLTFTLENMDAAGKPVGDLRFAVQFHKDKRFLDLGRRLSGLRDVGEPLGEKGKRVVVKVMGLEGAQESLAGAKPVLRLTPK